MRKKRKNTIKKKKKTKKANKKATKARTFRRISEMAHVKTKDYFSKIPNPVTTYVRESTLRQ
jgi:hypothetical protein